jgi:hypothetical protein
MTGFMDPMSTRAVGSFAWWCRWLVRATDDDYPLGDRLRPDEIEPFVGFACQTIKQHDGALLSVLFRVFPTIRSVSNCSRTHPVARWLPAPSKPTGRVSKPSPRGPRNAEDGGGLPGTRSRSKTPVIPTVWTKSRTVSQGWDHGCVTLWGASWLPAHRQPAAGGTIAPLWGASWLPATGNRLRGAQ